MSRGEFNSSKKRERQEHLTYDEIIAQLHRLNAEVEDCFDRVKNDREVIDLLSSLYIRKAGQASDLLFLLDYPSRYVLEALANLLAIYQGKLAKRLLYEVNTRRGVDPVKQIPLPGQLQN